jgi:hypothetical protein
MHIRKISIGPDYKSGAMHYIDGQTVLDGTYTIHLISKTEESTKIFIEKENEILLWKEFSANVPISYEYNINI